MKKYILLLLITCLLQTISSMSKRTNTTNRGNANKRVLQTPDVAFFAFLASHIKKNGTTYTCNYNGCSDELIAATLWKHVQQHIFSLAIYCPGCNEWMKSGSTLVTHIENDKCPFIHAIGLDENERRYYCKVCLSHIDSYENIASHVKTHHRSASASAQSSSFVCSGCKRNFASRQRLQRHQNGIKGLCRYIKEAGQNFICTLCKDSRFETRRGAMIHCNIHKPGGASLFTSWYSASDYHQMTHCSTDGQLEGAVVLLSASNRFCECAVEPRTSDELVETIGHPDEYPQLDAAP